MPDGENPYQSARVALVTMHAKERAVARPLRQRLAIEIDLVSGINTDLFGTFTGETPRAGSMAVAARAKALTGISATGLPFGIGSEGSFGPDPGMPLVAVATELMTFVDRHRGLEIRESLRTWHTNFSSVTCMPGEDLTDFLAASRFPSHAAVVAPNEPAGQASFQKGIVDAAILKSAVSDACARSADGMARVTTDMRAHVNPTRMAIIRRLSRRLAERLASLCPVCRTPGFGERDIERGLPCSDCGATTDRALAHVERCVSCAFVRRRPAPRPAVDPDQCSHCNP
ncbi:MAG: DUF6671 family protein [Pseudomonadota bacterium]